MPQDKWLDGHDAKWVSLHAWIAADVGVSLYAADELGDLHIRVERNLWPSSQCFHCISALSKTLFQSV